ncbi:hypothetical protein AALK14_00840 [Butyricimonas hominis]|uniref:glucosamine inositolphosphorylceramide transferase family protein n=1 Tax=Butyricimonas TaxID=574697 RepID=UPI0035164A62
MKSSLFHWNIGLTSFIDTDFSLARISWLKHSYRDRFFADPFLLSVNEDFVEVLVEEFFYSEWRGVITLLVIDRKTTQLLERKVILELATHLSFPFIIEEKGEVFVLPENAASGKLSVYRYNTIAKELEFVKVLLDFPAVDPVIYKFRETYYLLCTQEGKNVNSDLYCFCASSFLGDYMKVGENAVKSDVSAGRCAGGIFTIGGNLYRAAQICTSSYGEGCTINMLNSFEPFQEKVVKRYMAVQPYKFGFHTLNKRDSVLVVDGLKFLFNPIAKLKLLFK